jgi:hypothetical protein
MLTSRIKDDLYEAVETARSSLPASKAELLSSVSAWRQQLGKTIAERPAECLIAAVAAGFLIGWWTKHK